MVSSELTLAECIYQPLKLNDLELAMTYERLFESGDISVVKVDGGILKRAAKHGAGSGLKLLDAVHYVSALEYGCRYFVTSDKRIRSSDNLQVVLIAS